MNIDLLIIKGMIVGQYSKYRKYLDDLFNNHTHVYSKIFKFLDYANQQNPVLEVNEVNFFSAYPFLKQNEQQLYGELFTRLKEIEPSQNFEALLNAYKRQSQALGLARAAVHLAEGGDNLSEVLSLAGRLENELAEEPKENEFVSDNLQELLNEQRADGGLTWRLNCLNRGLGPLRRGDFGFIFARPETGKTTFLASEISHFIEQVSADTPIIWFNNEEQGSKVKLRIIQSYFGLPISQLAKSAYYDEWEQRNGRVLVRDSATISRREVESIVRDRNPSLIVFDQIDKIKGFSDDRNDLELGQIYIWARELAKEFAPVIGVCQAGASAEDKMWLTMDDVVNAKTSKQAEADWIMGIGCRHDSDNLRFLHLSKNKLLGGPESVAEDRHGKFQVLIHPLIARYEDIQ